MSERIVGGVTPPPPNGLYNYYYATFGATTAKRDHKVWLGCLVFCILSPHCFSPAMGPLACCRPQIVLFCGAGDGGAVRLACLSLFLFVSRPKYSSKSILTAGGKDGMTWTNKSEQVVSWEKLDGISGGYQRLGAVRGPNLPRFASACKCKDS